MIRQFRSFPASDYVNLRVLRIVVVDAGKVAHQKKTMLASDPRPKYHRFLFALQHQQHKAANAGVVERMLGSRHPEGPGQGVPAPVRVGKREIEAADQAGSQAGKRADHEMR